MILQKFILTYLINSVHWVIVQVNVISGNWSLLIGNDKCDMKDLSGNANSDLSQFDSFVLRIVSLFKARILAAIVEKKALDDDS